MKKVIVTISPDGSIKVEAEGYKGNTCEQATAFLKQLGQVQGEEKKAEYFETPLQAERMREP